MSRRSAQEPAARTTGNRRSTRLLQTRGGQAFRIAAVVFDFDGTLTRPGAIDFAAIHKAVGCPKGMGLLEFLAAIDDPQTRLRKEAVLVEAEMRAAAQCEPNEGAQELVALLRQAGVPIAVVTRNRQEAVERALLNLEGIDADHFACIVSRDLPLSPKPSPEGVLHVARELGIQVRELLLIGDHAFDIEAGVRAGSLTMFLSNGPGKGRERRTVESDFLVRDLLEAREIIRYGIPLPLGKLPAEWLREGLGEIEGQDAAVLVGAALGEDAAAVDVAEAEVLVLASDPITLASDSLARYLVMANANDVAAAGAIPRWLLATLLFPRGTSASQVIECLRDVQSACAANGLSLVGGHTEITDSVTRLVAVGTVAGTVQASGLLDKRRMREGDRLLLTKGVAVEGTGLIAREFGTRLTKAGIPAAEVAECATFLDRIGIVAEAGIARGFAGVSAMHDVTEGGLATAVQELGAAGGRRLRVHMEKIPVYPQTKRVCEALGLDPLGLIGSGSLLITCDAADAAGLCRTLLVAGVEVAEIGEVLGFGEGVEAFEGGRPVKWPVFERDEVSRLER
jgi:hydrogenase expression/formation protein HypE